MTMYIALLRGINVGGKNMIKMAELKKMFEGIGLSRVQTYIQSGNVLFESNEEELPLRKRIEHEIKVVFGYSVTVMLRTDEDLNHIVANCPFSKDAISKAEASAVGESLYVSFLLEEPSQQDIERLGNISNENDQFLMEGREVYLLFSHSIRKSKLVNSLQKLDVPSTIRNWKTINELVMLASNSTK